VSAAQIAHQAATLLLAGIVLSACAGTTAPSAKSTTAPSSTETPRQAAERQALAAYAGTSNPSDPELAKYTSSNALATIAKKLTADRSAGLVSKGEITVHPTVSAASPTSAPTIVNLLDCADDSRWLRYRKDNGQLSDTPGGRHRVTAIVQQIGGWRVTSFALDDKPGTC
jgi:hypothetical protein